MKFDWRKSQIQEYDEYQDYINFISLKSMIKSDFIFLKCKYQNSWSSHYLFNYWKNKKL